MDFLLDPGLQDALKHLRAFFSLIRTLISVGLRLQIIGWSVLGLVVFGFKYLQDGDYSRILVYFVPEIRSALQDLQGMFDTRRNGDLAPSEIRIRR